MSTLKKSGSSGWMGGTSDFQRPNLSDIEVFLSPFLGDGVVFSPTSTGELSAPPPLQRLAKFKLSTLTNLSDLFSRSLQYALASDALQLQAATLTVEDVAIYFQGTRCFLPNQAISARYLPQILTVATDGIRQTDAIDASGSTVRLVFTLKDDKKNVQTRRSYAS